MKGLEESWGTEQQRLVWCEAEECSTGHTGPVGLRGVTLQLGKALEVFDAWRGTGSDFWCKDFSGCSTENRFDEANSEFWAERRR